MEHRQCVHLPISVWTRRTACENPLENDLRFSILQFYLSLFSSNPVFDSVSDPFCFDHYGYLKQSRCSRLYKTFNEHKQKYFKTKCTVQELNSSLVPDLLFLPTPLMSLASQTLFGMTMSARVGMTAQTDWHSV